jgi:4-amino-4-deoxy-L-arabinose transferase-like glycosyltransferase
MRVAFLTVALLALACLLVRAGRVGMAGDYIDPVGKIGAQDESLYAHSAIHMARQGAWLTPMFMGRFGLYKPPLLAAVTGLSARILGISRLTLRLPVALIAALAVGLVFWWGAEEHSWQAGACAAALLVSNHLWLSLSSMCLTDGLLAAFYIAAMFALYADPWLEAWWSVAMFSGAVAAAILTKSIAGLLPLGVLGLYWLLAPRKQRPTFARVILVGSLAVALAAPWFVYQMSAHGRWFRAEHINVEILGFGAGAPPQTSQESHLAFYASRMALTDPVLMAMAITALLGLWHAVRRRSAAALLLLLWLALPMAAAFKWQYRNVTYLLPAIPAMAILASAYNPLCSGRSAKWMMLLLATAFVAKAAMPQASWGLWFGPGTKVEATLAESDYCARARGNDLVLVDTEDEMYASLLPLPGIHYVMPGTPPPSADYGMDFSSMGIILDAQQFAALDHWTPIFRQRLREWGLDSDEPIGTVVFNRSVEEVALLVRTHPDTDFLLPERYRPIVALSAAASHEVVPAAPGRILLLSRHALPTPAGQWSCHL